MGTPDVTACVVALFPEETFDEGKADFSFICQATDPLNAVIDVQSQIVSGRRVRSGVTPGMREWSHLGWYQVAAYAVMRGHCCASAAAHKWTLELPCPFDEAVAKLEAAARAHDEQVLEGALGYYTTTARCLARAGLARAFQLRGVPGPGMAAFRHLLQRMREADRR